jgi:putative exporter of polyketide antibiotics
MSGIQPRLGTRVTGLGAACVPEGSSMKIAIAVVAALCAAFCFALGALIQQGAARQTHARTLRFGLLVALAHERRWLAGIAITVVSFGIQGAELAFGPLALVQPLVATEVLFALPMWDRQLQSPSHHDGPWRP